MKLNAAAVDLLERQLGVISRAQLLDLDHGVHRVEAAVRRRHLVPVHRGVYKRPGTPRSPSQDAIAARLRAGPDARVTGSLLLALLGCEGYDPASASFVVLVPRGRRPTQVRFRWRTDLAPDRHGATVASVPGVTPERALCELALDELSDDQLLLAVDRLRWRTGRGSDRLRRTASELPEEHAGARRLERLGALDEGRPESPGERRLDEALGELDPPLEWQVWITPTIRVDALWRDCAIVIEHDGPTHTGPRARRRDAARDAALEALGYLVVRTTAEDLRHPAALRRRLELLRRTRLGR
jgi:hypothetical protein